MKIDILCHDGSPMGVTLEDLYGSANRVGVGGAEYALLTLCEAWTDAGHEVVVYNDPKNPAGSRWEHRAVSTFDPNGQRDVILTFRAPNPLAIFARGMKVWWSCDPYTRADADFKKFSGHMEKIVTISPRHQRYFEATYGIKKSIPIDIPVRTQDLNVEVERVPKRCIFTSVPDRGLSVLRQCWNSIKQAVPDVSLVITSDYRLWGAGALNDNHRATWLMEPDVKFLGAISRAKLVEEQLKAELLTYPSTYDELFCVAVAEAQACGVYPVTSDTGSLPTTNMGTVLSNTPTFKTEFIDTVVELLKNPDLDNMRSDVRQDAVNRFSPEAILEEWNEKIFA